MLDMLGAFESRVEFCPQDIYFAKKHIILLANALLLQAEMICSQHVGPRIFSNEVWQEEGSVFVKQVAEDGKLMP